MLSEHLDTVPFSYLPNDSVEVTQHLHRCRHASRRLGGSAEGEEHANLRHSFLCGVHQAVAYEVEHHGAQVSRQYDECVEQQARDENQYNLEKLPELPKYRDVASHEQRREDDRRQEQQKLRPAVPSVCGWRGDSLQLKQVVQDGCQRGALQAQEQGEKAHYGYHEDTAVEKCGDAKFSSQMIFSYINGAQSKG